MQIRTHLVRFMYINLILSCGFWLYDNVAAADASAKNAKSATTTSSTEKAMENNAAAASLVAPPLDEAAPNNKAADVQVEILPNYKKVKKVAADAATASSARLVENTGAVEHGTAPTASTPSVSHRTNAKTAQNAVKDTSVVREMNKVEADPADSVHRSSSDKSNSEDISVVSNSEIKNSVAANEKHAEMQREAAVADAASATAKVPKNQFDSNINSNNNDAVFSETLVGNSKQQQVEQPKSIDVSATRPTLETPAHSTDSFPEIITELPTVTVTELPLEHVKNRMDTVVVDNVQPMPGEQQRNKSEEQQKQQQQQQQLFENGKAAAQTDEQILKINDPGGGVATDATSVVVAEPNNVTVEETATAAAGEGGETLVNDTTSGANITAEEVPMPVFSEWAQKQMEAEASREQAMEQEQQVVNNSAQRRNATGTVNGKPPTLKLRAKNYASPDCGAKIIASNADATNTGAVLSHSSDEYMLSPCGNRIWFVVELCEAIQAQKVELANFELFSSSPKNFTVAVSKRFPTRDWSNVGRFAAEDKRTVQTFDLHPHLFGKFVRLDIHSHYSKEHFCPVSLFRVFGTSEFEAFETEIRPSDELDDFYDDFTAQEQAHANKAGGNIFQSASDAVMQMVKKAAEVLVKPTKALRWSSESLVCSTPTFDVYTCGSCNSTLVERINRLLSCQLKQLQFLLTLPQLRAQLQETRICHGEFGLRELSVSLPSDTSGLAKNQSYYLSLLPNEYVGAMCKLVEAQHNATLRSPPERATPPAVEQESLNVVGQQVDNVTTAQAQGQPATTSTAKSVVEKQEPTPAASSSETLINTPVLAVPAPTEINAVQQQQAEQQQQQKQLPEQPVDAASTASSASAPSAPTPNSAEVNIFNVPAEAEVVEVPVASEKEPELDAAATAAKTAEASEQDTTTTATSATPATTAVANNEAMPSVVAAGDVAGGSQATGSGYDDSQPNWDSIDNLLGTTVASITAGGGAAAAAAAVVNGNGQLGSGAAAGAGAAINLQQKLANGAQSESVFIRLSNRIKALERNMSLSGQYLEELSRRYKKQVEELQQTLTQQTLTVRTLEDQSRRYIEQEQLYQRQSAELAGEVRSLTYQVQACIMVIIVVGTCIFLMLVLGTVYYRKLRRQLHPQVTASAASNSKEIKQQLNRRKSYEDMLEPAAQKQRRPSEEAMLILKECVESEAPADSTSNRQRKISVCYGSNNNITANMLTASARASLHKRKGAKNSWHSNSLDTATAETSGVEQLDKFFDLDTLKSIHKQQQQTKASRKKSQQQALKRQESAPGNFNQGNTTQTSLAANSKVEEEEPTQSDFDESLILDDEDLANFIPNSDLAYNEFMPEGPSGYQIVVAVDGSGQPCKEQQTAKQPKSRRLSSPSFFKSPFTKSKTKSSSLNGSFAGNKLKNSHSAHEATSWEWYRLRRFEKQQKHLNSRSLSATTPNASLDSSSLSEINFPINSTKNSFRILGEAIRSSGEPTLVHANGNAVGDAINSNSSGSGSGSVGSSSSFTTKKKQRAFNNLFRKVF